MCGSSKLTKRFFMSLPQHAYVMSNTFDGDSPVFSGLAGATPAEREHTWKVIVASGANGRLCHVFNNAARAQSHLDELNAVTSAQRAQRRQAIESVRAASQ